MTSTSATPRFTNDATANETHSLSVTFVPSFQGTLLLYRSLTAAHGASPEPLHLCPLSRHSVSDLYTKVLSRRISISDRVEYAQCRCAPRPYSHEGHCNVMPVRNSGVSLLRAMLSAASVRLKTVPYDWTMRSEAIVSTFIAPALQNGDSRIVIAHGSACGLVAAALSNNHVFVCAFPVANSTARSAIEEGEDSELVNVGHSHRYFDAMSEANVHSTFMSDVDAGISKRRLRRLSPDLVDGPWGRHRKSEEAGLPFAAERQVRKEFFSRIEFLAEFARTDDRIQPRGSACRYSVCIESMKDRNCRRLFESANEVVVANTNDMYDLSESVAQVVKKLLASNLFDS